MNSSTIIPAAKELQFNYLIRILLICGILSPLVYVGADIAAANQWDSYSYTNQSLSELMAIEAPTRPFMVNLNLIYSILLLVFGFGILITKNRGRFQRVTGILIILFAVSGLAGLLFYPMHSRGAETTMSSTDFMHIIDTIVLILSMLLSIVFGAFADSKGFRIYSFITILLIFLFGIIALMDIPEIAAGQPTPWLGIKERINIYSYMLWLLVLAVILLKNEKEAVIIDK